jgi:heme oxygenase
MEVQEQAVPAPIGPAAITALRSATRHHHAQLEEQLRLGHDFSLAQYHRVLIAFASFLAAWEPRLAQALPAARRPWFRQRCRLQLARQDLAVLGLQDPGPPRTFSLDLADSAAAWGSLYVMEGSALGGQVIAARLLRSHGIGPCDGAAYFAGRGRATAPMWREFQQLLRQAVHAPAQVASASGAAVRTFEALAAVFEEAR